MFTLELLLEVKKATFDPVKHRFISQRLKELVTFKTIVENGERDSSKATPENSQESDSVKKTADQTGQPSEEKSPDVK